MPRFGMRHPGRVHGLLVTNTEHGDSAGLQELVVSSQLQWWLVMQGCCRPGTAGLTATSSMPSKFWYQADWDLDV